MVRLSLAILLSLTSIRYSTDLVGMASTGHSLTFSQVLAAKFDLEHPQRFKELHDWAERPTQKELRNHYVKVPGKDNFYQEKVPCWDMDTKGMVRAMVAAADYDQPSEADDAWKAAQRLFSQTKLRVAEDVAKAERDTTKPTKLAKELAVRAARDQTWLAAQTGLPANGAAANAAFWRLQIPICHVNEDNAKFLSGLVKRRKWPRISTDGLGATHDAFLLIQHADKHLQLQEEALDLIGPLAQKHEVPTKLYAALFDRVRLAQGKPQRYGTQFEEGPDGCSAVRSVEDPTELDRRRAEVGLDPMDRYEKQLSSVYGIRVCSDIVKSETEIHRGHDKHD